MYKYIIQCINTKCMNILMISLKSCVQVYQENYNLIQLQLNALKLRVLLLL